MIVDSHCHLNYEPMYSSLKDVISRAKTKKVDYLLTISTVDKDYEKLCDEFKNILLKRVKIIDEQFLGVAEKYL